MKKRLFSLLMAVLLVILALPTAVSARPQSEGGNPGGSYTVYVGQTFRMEYWGTDYTDYTGQYMSEYTIITGADKAVLSSNSITFTKGGTVNVESKTYEYVGNHFSNYATRTDRWYFTVKDDGPVIKVQPKDCTIGVDGKVNFDVTAYGSDLTYQWIAINPGTSYKSTYPKQKESKFSARPAGSDKQYYCIITDAQGRKVTTDTVNVLQPTGSYIKTQPKDQTYDPAGTMDFTCQATVKTTYQWYLTTEDQYLSSYITWGDAIKEYGIKVSGANSYSLRLENVPMEMDGMVVYCEIAGYRSTEPAAMNCTTKPVSEIEINGSWNSVSSQLVNVSANTPGVKISNVTYSMNGKKMDTVAPGDKIEVGFSVQTNDGYAFVENCTADWDGKANELVVKESDTTRRFTYTVTVPAAKEKTAIETVNAYVDAPAAGEALDMTAAVQQASGSLGGPKQKFSRVHYTITDVKWLDVAAGKYVETAEAGKTYQVQITAAPSDTYKFTNATKAYVNDTQAEIKSAGEASMTFCRSFTLDATAPAQPEAPVQPQQPSAPAEPAKPADPAKPAAPAEEHSIKLYIGKLTTVVDGEEVENDVAPLIRNNRTFVPVRIVSEMMGMDVGWNGKTRQVTIENGDDEVVLTIGSEEAEANGKAVMLDAAPFIMNNRTFVPIRFVSENLGLHVEWDGTERSVLITPEE